MATGTDEEWQQVAIEIFNSVYRLVNTPDMVGGEHETGCVLMFFNRDHHQGKSTFVSSPLPKGELKKLLKEAIRQIGGPNARFVGPHGRMQ